jgi:hypothetical protein
MSATATVAIIGAISTPLVALAGFVYNERRAHADRAANRELAEAQHREEHLRNRQAAYLDFLNAERHFEVLVMDGSATRDDFLKFNDVANRVAILGLQPVTTLAATLASEYGAVYEAARKAAGTGAPGSPAQIIAAYNTRKAAITKTRVELVDAMRADVAPD